LTRKNPS